MESKESRASRRVQRPLPEEWEVLLCALFVAVPGKERVQIVPRPGAMDRIDRWWDEVEKRP